MATVTVEQIEESARKLIGAPFLHQGRSPYSGIDCIGTIIFVATDSGYLTQEDLKGVDRTDYRRSADAFETMMYWVAKFADEVPLSEVGAGDVVGFRMPGETVTSHVGTVVRGYNELMLIHSLYGKTTVEVPLRRWFRYATKAFRFRGLE